MKPAFTLPSPQTGTDYLIFVETPPAGEPGPHPAVLCMDGDDQFRFAVEAYRALRVERAVVPLVMVGVGYGASYAKPANKRLRDYTPTQIATEAGSGGAEAFLAFLTATLWPALAQRLSLREDVRGLAGHSLGSLLAVPALFREQPFFNRVLASAPSLWWDDRAALGHVERARATVTAVPAKLFLSVGEDDSESMTGDLALLERQLADRPFAGLEVISRRFPQRNHFDVLPDAFRAGLTALFAP
jgi:predicted alpha/beta superfamily hydrolase